jgi:hypothetical protein
MVLLARFFVAFSSFDTAAAGCDMALFVERRDALLDMRETDQRPWVVGNLAWINSVTSLAIKVLVHRSESS